MKCPHCEKEISFKRTHFKWVEKKPWGTYIKALCHTPGNIRVSEKPEEVDCKNCRSVFQINGIHATN